MKLIKWVWFHYREFYKHPEFRGPQFNWFVPLQLGFNRWRYFR